MAGNAYLTLGYAEKATQCYGRATHHDASLHSAYRYYHIINKCIHTCIHR